MGGYVLVDNGHLTEKEARLNMEQCADFLARMIQKYGPEILAELAEKDAKESGGMNQMLPAAFRAVGSFPYKAHK